MAVEKALNPMPSGDMEYTDDIVTEIVVETDGNTGETTIGIAEMPESEALVPHDANIAEILDEQDLVEMAMALVDTYHQDRQSRSEWEETLVEGMDLLGVKLEEVTEPFEVRVVHHTHCYLKHVCSFKRELSVNFVHRMGR